jgi:UDP-glucuronate decarboxylase
LRAVITGAAGFVGSRVLRRFVAAGWDVVAVVRPGSDRRRIAGVEGRVEILKVDLLQALDCLEPVASGTDVFVHAAWDTTPGRYLTSPTNTDYVVAGADLLGRLNRCGCRRFVGLGSCQEYAPSNQPLAEDAPLAPRVPYAMAKAGLGLIVQSLSEQNRMTGTWLRIFNVYGSGESEQRLVPYVIKRLLAGEPAEVSEGLQVRDYLHVDDVASAVLAVAASDVSGAVNVGSGHPVRVRQVVEELIELLEGGDLVRFGARGAHPGEVPFQVADNRKLLGTGWQQRFTLREGLSDTVAWWRKNNEPKGRTGEA